MVVDEVQRVSALLNAVHSLIARHGRRWTFAPCGSCTSAVSFRRPLPRVSNQPRRLTALRWLMFPYCDSGVAGFRPSERRQPRRPC